MNPRFGRVITAMITPFNSDGSLDVQGACDLAQWLAEQGNNALVLAGTTGESPTITQDEQIQLVEAVVQAVDIPVIAGASFLGLKDLYKESVEFNSMIIFTVFFSYFFSYFTIKYFLIFVKKFDLKLFVIYRILLSILLFGIIYF